MKQYGTLVFTYKGRTERITIDLGGRSAEEVKDLLDLLPQGLQLLDKQEQEARLKAN